MNIVILGCGRVGSRVAAALDAGNDVTVIDRDTRSFGRLPTDFPGRTVRGHGIDYDALRSAGAQEADVFLALTNHDDRNLMAAQVAAQLGARKTIARVYDPVRATIFEPMGLSTICPTVNGAQRLFDMIVGEGRGS